ncbi:MAG: fibrobacter succinogenes major paralogous domain-containing protein [Fibrobacter sp.]|nr:fibrobacter succinogenes major paralogous domain-containing protein [Fibrobacter sp.]
MPCKTDEEDNCEYGILKDSRDGQEYKTVKIGGQVWMAENLNYAYTGVPFDNGSYTSDSTSWCYDNVPANCAKYGRLYTWAAAMDSVGTWSANGKGCGDGKECSATSPVRGVCPKGWHLPSNDEWKALIVAVAASITEYTSSNRAGAKLRSATGWRAYSGITNEDAFGFSALPAGYRYYDGDYVGEGSFAGFWSSTEDGSNGAYEMNLNYNDANAPLRGKRHKSSAFSVRCVKD